ncbi:MAG: MFS transporter [Alphaproteobacteria bacterium]|nr:MFS transporter [Alphaproteobacteria bacterium]
MTKALAPVAALLLGVGILLTGNGLQGTLLPLRARLEDFDVVDIGVLGSAYFVGFVLGCLVGPYLVRRAGHIRTFAALTAIASTVVLAHPLALSPIAWWIMRATTGFCFAGLYLVIESWLNERSNNQNRGLIMAVYTIINLTVITLGQMMITLYDPSEFALFNIASILVSLAAVPVAMSAAPGPAPVEGVRLRPTHLLKLSPVGFVGCFAVGVTNGSFWSLGPLFAADIGMDTTGIAVFMSATVLGGALLQWPLGRLSDRMDRRKVIALACLLAGGAGAALVAWAIRDIDMVIPAAVVFGAFTFSIYALCAAHANDFATHGSFVEMASGLLLVNGIGSVLGPIAAAFFMEGYGPAGLFVVTAVVHVAMAGFALYRLAVRKAVPDDLKPVFVAAAPGAVTLDPRAEHPDQTPAQAGA